MTDAHERCICVRMAWQAPKVLVPPGAPSPPLFNNPAFNPAEDPSLRAALEVDEVRQARWREQRARERQQAEARKQLQAEREEAARAAEREARRRQQEERARRAQRQVCPPAAL